MNQKKGLLLAMIAAAGCAYYPTQEDMDEAMRVRNDQFSSVCIGRSATNKKGYLTTSVGEAALEGTAFLRGEMVARGSSLYRPSQCNLDTVLREADRNNDRIITEREAMDVYNPTAEAFFNHSGPKDTNPQKNYGEHRVQHR